MKSTEQYSLLISSREATRGDSIASFGTLTIRIVHIDGEKISVPKESALNGLVFACQWNEHNPNEPTYSWKTFYREVWTIERADAERMVKTLRKVNRISSGAIASFGQYVARIAGVLKIELALKDSRQETRVPSYNFNEYVRVQPSEIASVIDGVVAEVRKSAVKSVGA